MIREKQKLIRKSGIPVEVTDLEGVSASTIALVGRANKQFNNTVSLESHRRAHFLPDVMVDSGYIVHNTLTEEDYIIVSVYDDIIRQQKASTVTHMLKCNGSIQVSGDEETADSKGNLKKIPVVKHSDVKVYAQPVTMELRQYDPGLHADAEYLLFAPGVMISVLDRIVLTTNSVSISFKVIAVDYISYPGLARIQVRSETRR